MRENKTYLDPKFERALKKEANRARENLYQAAEQYIFNPQARAVHKEAHRSN